MSKSEIVAKIIVKVHLITGRVIAHEYNTPTSKKELEQLIARIVDMEMALTRGGIRFLQFENPHVTYNADNVVGIEFSTIGTGELKDALERAQRKVGFH